MSTTPEAKASSASERRPVADRLKVVLIAMVVAVAGGLCVVAALTSFAEWLGLNAQEQKNVVDLAREVQADGTPETMNRRPTNEDVIKLHKRYIYALHKDLPGVARKHCWQNDGKLHPTDEEWQLASRQWCHMGDIDVTVNKIRRKRDLWVVHVDVAVKMYSLPVRHQGRQPIGGGVALGTCRPVEATARAKWYVAWEGGELRFVRALSSGLY